ncbi:MAG: sigma-70 family RNA polymerase sigma factor [Blastocatellia bacterium]
MLDSDPVKAAERYELNRQKLIRYFIKRGYRDPENLADETLARAHQVMSQIEKFIFGIARNVGHEDFRQREKEGQTVDVSEVTLRSLDNPDKLDTDCLKQCLQKLPPKERALIIFYPDCEPQEREALAKHLGMTLGGLRSKVAGIRKKLNKCAKDC